MRVTKCWDTASYLWRKWTSFPVLSSKLRPVLKLLDQYGFPNTCAPKLFFSIPLTLKTRYELPIISLRHALMIQEISRRFDKLKFIFIEFSGPTTIMQSWTVPLNKIPAMVAFDSHLTSLSLSLSHFPALKIKIWKNCYPSALNLKRAALFHCLPVWDWCSLKRDSLVSVMAKKFAEIWVYAMKYFIITKHIDCTKLLQVLASLYL